MSSSKFTKYWKKEFSPSKLYVVQFINLFKTKLSSLGWQWTKNKTTGKIPIAWHTEIATTTAEADFTSGYSPYRLEQDNKRIRELIVS